MNAADTLRAELAQKQEEQRLLAKDVQAKYDADVAEAKANAITKAKANLPFVIEKIKVGMLEQAHKMQPWGYLVQVPLWTHYRTNPWEKCPPHYVGDYECATELTRLLTEEGFPS